MAYNNEKYNNNLNLYSQEVIDLFYPIGRGFIDFTDTDYSNYLGCTWERELVGMTAVGLDTNQTEFNTIGKTGGEKIHTLTVDEIPNHNHSITIHRNSGSGAMVAQSSGVGGSVTGQWWVVGKTGGDKAHNNLQPYKVVAYWKRVS